MAGGTGNVRPLWETIWQFLKKLNTCLPSDPAIPILGFTQEK